MQSHAFSDDLFQTVVDRGFVTGQQRSSGETRGFAFHENCRSSSTTIQSGPYLSQADRLGDAAFRDQLSRLAAMLQNLPDVGLKNYTEVMENSNPYWLNIS